jgi:dynein heavy chain 2
MKRFLSNAGIIT